MKDFSKITEADGENGSSHKALYEACLTAGQTFCENVKNVQEYEVGFKEKIAKLLKEQFLYDWSTTFFSLCSRNEKGKTNIGVTKEHCGFMWSKAVQGCKRSERIR